ncbi:MAG: C40 family peptidase [Actinomycetes bacterium]
MRPTRGRTSRRITVPALVFLFTASLLGIGTVNADPADARTSRPAATAIRYALNQLGDPYRWAATGPGSFDCSGLTQSAYREAGVWIPRTSRAQFSAGPKVARSRWKPGDLVYWGRPVHHVAIFLGRHMVLHSPRPGRVVSIDEMWSSGLRHYGTRPAGRSARGLLKVFPGSSGDHVRAVQKRLRANGHSLRVSGRYTEETRRLIARIQSRLGWDASGTTGPGTWGYLVRHGAKRRAS